MAQVVEGRTIWGAWERVGIAKECIMADPILGWQVRLVRTTRSSFSTIATSTVSILKLAAASAKLLMPGI